MRKWIVALSAVIGSVAHAGTAFVDGVLQSADGSMPNAYSLGVLDRSPVSLFVVTEGAANSTFEEFANFSINGDADVTGTASTYSLNFMGLDIVDITNLTVALWSGSSGSGSGSLLGTFTGNGVTTALGTLTSGLYHLEFDGPLGPNALAGKYAVSLDAVPAVPEPGTYAMMLAGLGVLGFMARRRQQA